MSLLPANNTFPAWDAPEETFPLTVLHELLAAQAERTPDATALAFRDQLLTYQQLHDRANQLAHYLQTLGVGPDSIVGICMERSFAMVIALMGILKAGGVYLPLDPEYPEKRLQFMLNDAQPVALLIQHKWKMLAPQGQWHTICLDEGNSPFEHLSCSLPAHHTKPAHLAYVMYTSGSTGQPKGVLIPHRGVCNRLLWMQQTYRLDETDHVLQKTPFSFDVSVWEFFWPLIAGATLILAEPGGHKDARSLCDLISKQAITTMHFVPSMLSPFLDEEGLERCSSLRRVFSSGEALSLEVQKRFFERFSTLPDLRLYNLYGPTEASIDVTHWTCLRNDPRSCVPIGYPIANTRMYILGDDLQPVPLGEIGELYIGGVGLARGYLRREALTGERFIPHPPGLDDEAVIYKTGDRGRYLPDGAIEFLGRLDQQIKIRGFRIELGEIESVLDQHPAVRKSVVLAAENPAIGTYLIAYLLMRESAMPGRGGTCPRPDSGASPYSMQVSFQAYLRAYLPEYMIPLHLVCLDALPLTPGGKLDRQALAAQARLLSPVEEQDHAHAYATATEQRLAELWRDLFCSRLPAPTEDFFALGGHSLLAMQLVSRIRKCFHVELTPGEVFKYSTLTELATAVEAKQHSIQSAHEMLIERVDRMQPLDLSFAQQRLWFLHQLEPESSSYVIVEAMSLRGDIRDDLLERCLKILVERHEALRTTFLLLDDRPVQRVGAAAPATYTLTKHVATGGFEEALRFLQQEASRPFDLERGPLFRPYLIEVERDEYIFAFMMHHIISDGWSLHILRQELVELWNALYGGAQPRLPDLAPGYADYARWQQRMLEGETGKVQRAYWLEQLRGVPPFLDLPTDFPRPDRLAHRAAYHHFTLPESLIAALRQFCSATNTTLFMVCLAAFSLLLARYSGQDDIVVGVPIAGRTSLEMERVIGFFVNTLVFRTRFTGNPPFSQVLQQVREYALGAYAYQDIPFEQLIALLQPSRSLNRLPLVQVILNVQESAPDLLFTGLQQKPLLIEDQMTKVDLKLDMIETKTGLRCDFEYSREVFAPERISVMAAHFAHVLKQIIAAPEKNCTDYVLHVGEYQ